MRSQRYKIRAMIEYSLKAHRIKLLLISLCQGVLVLLIGGILLCYLT